MKMYNKKDLKMKDGLLVADDGNVILVDPKVVEMANDLETDLQKARYIYAQPSSKPVPSLDGFERKSERSVIEFECETPLMDKKQKEAIEYMDELDSMTLNDKMNKMLNRRIELVMFAKSSEVFGMDNVSVCRFDTPMLGNPLEWTEKTIADAVAEIHGCKIFDEDEQSE